MKARTTVLSMIFVALFAVSAGAQQYYRPYYSQRELLELQAVPVFMENRTGGHLKVRLEVNGLTYTVEVQANNEVPDLMLPVGAKVKVKDARAVVLDGGKIKSKKVRYYAYWREDGNGRAVQQGWLFYVDKYFRP
ncbi:MAG: hypothetical protein HY505_01170 [Candidatus Yanofskybacteria bacterium]|nr:hypothetical protein [Candidatus Yanofskybacteria bacterium]